MHTKEALLVILESHQLPAIEIANPPTRADRLKVAMAIRKLDYYLAAELVIGQRIGTEHMQAMFIHLGKREIQSEDEGVAYEFLSGFASEDMSG